jgi:hypothetical protein
VNIVSTLLEGTETNGGLQVDDGGCVLGLLGLGDGVGDGVKVTEISFDKIVDSLVTLLDVENVPSVRLVSHLDVLSEGASGVTVNGDF